MTNSLLLIVEVVNGVLILWRNSLHSGILNRGQDLFRRNWICSLIFEDPANVKMITRVWRVEVTHMQILNYLRLTQLSSKSISDWDLFRIESLLNDGKYLSRVFEKHLCGQAREIIFIIIILNSSLILDLLTHIIALYIDLNVLRSFLARLHRIFNYLN